MKWETAARYDWTGTISNRPEKEEVARRIAGNVKNGDVIGVGSGSTSFLAIGAIAKRVHSEGLTVSAIRTLHREVEMISARLPVCPRTIAIAAVPGPTGRLTAPMKWIRTGV